ncbi:hypothetical protein [Streptomyces griseorubiginosus]|uniref:hypothetical protein n=1 Tax=Streptomyces griseorubiginosus TaxID=67304 RepID=UPI0036E5BBFC
MSELELLGARAVFAARLRELIAGSGLPLDRIAAKANARRRSRATWSMDAKRLSDWQRGTHLPRTDEPLLAVIAVLRDQWIEHADGYGFYTPYLLSADEWRRRLRIARAAPPIGVSQPGAQRPAAGAGTGLHAPVVQGLADLWVAIGSVSTPGALTYEVIPHDDGTQEIRPTAAGIEEPGSGCVLEPQDYWHTPWSDLRVLPQLDVKVVNNTGFSVFVDQAVLHVASSVKDRSPVLAIALQSCWEMGFKIDNFGWGPVLNAQLAFDLTPEDTDEPTLRYRRELTSGAIDLRREFQAGGLDVSGFKRALEMEYDGDAEEEYRKSLLLTALGPFRTGIGHCKGILEYDGYGIDGAVHRRRTLINVPVAVGRYPVGAPVPPSETYDAELDAERHNYDVFVPVSQGVKASEFDRFLIRLGCARSSRHEFTVTIRHSHGAFTSPPIRLRLFQPRTVSSWNGGI